MPSLYDYLTVIIKIVLIITCYLSTIYFVAKFSYNIFSRNIISRLVKIVIIIIIFNFTLPFIGESTDTSLMTTLIIFLTSSTILVYLGYCHHFYNKLDKDSLEAIKDFIDVEINRVEKFYTLKDYMSKLGSASIQIDASIARLNKLKSKKDEIKNIKNPFIPDILVVKNSNNQAQTLEQNDEIVIKNHKFEEQRELNLKNLDNEIIPLEKNINIVKKDIATVEKSIANMGKRAKQLLPIDDIHKKAIYIFNQNVNLLEAKKYITETINLHFEILYKEYND
ncbi:hypothetical protein [Campylobacter geochelonis]|uniref:Uncharacterized protein n=1 Tax=Campylobacter geochelonis TaxID=1780362 RepID=A0A128ERD7_9BACT|nr:hypothetical protein [Campylobacter geochelonis]QKF71913.1 putative membrane protein [Campylobacter geochelonis]CZE47137.1 Uncharacterised protein [Campylobacter geochelonis]CZE47885.1 Uncharacterised protein [Campylobacter geochelonis]CZE51025.1 Uncharacterised protein [Campylobacter geochelonis]